MFNQKIFLSRFLVWLVTFLAAPATSVAQELEEVIVTAQKREQNLQDVSAPVSAVSAERLKDAGVTNLQELQYYIPNITIGNSFGYANLFMRGLGLDTVFANVDPSVTLYVDGSVISQPGAQLFSFFDLERAEVLRGPQGTLYGRNATGGTINLIAAKPSADFSGHARLIGGNHGLLQADAAIGGPLSSWLQGRIAVQTMNRDGYGRNIVTGHDVDDTNKQSARVQLLFLPSDTVSILLAGEYGREDDAANALFFKRQTFLPSDNPSIAYPPNSAAPGNGGFPTKTRDYASDVDPVNDRETRSISGTFDWKISDAFALKSILNHRNTELLNFQDLDASAVRASAIQEFVFAADQTSAELQLNYSGSRLQGILGAYYFTEDLHHLNNIDVLKEGGSFAGGTEKRVNLTGDGETDSWAAFWNGTYNFSDAFAVKAGGRYTEDRRSIVNDNIIYAGPTRLTPLFSANRTFSDYTNEAGLEWRPLDDLLLYYTYSEGFKAGTGELGANSGTIIDPETITNHELGLKSTWGGRFVLNIAVYGYRIDGVQLDRTLPGGPTGFITVFENATYQDGEGVEVETSWLPTERLRLNASVIFQKTEFGPFTTFDPIDVRNLRDNRTPPPPGGPALVPPYVPFSPQSVNIRGNSARQAPKWAGNLHVEYDFVHGNSGTLTLSADGSYKGAYFFSEFNDGLLRQSSYKLFDARMRYTSANGQWTAEVWGRNLGDELIESANFALATGRVITRTYLPPRTWGATIGYSF